MKRWKLIVLWFVLLIAFNYIVRTTASPDMSSLIASVGFRCETALIYLLSPIEIVLSIIVVVAIWKIVGQRKAIAEEVIEQTESQTK